MRAWLPSVTLTAASVWALPVLLDSGVKGVAILALAGVAALARRKSSAAARHLVWSLSMLGLLLLPVLSAVLPAWQVLPRWWVLGTDEPITHNAIESSPRIDEPHAFTEAPTVPQELPLANQQMTVDEPPMPAAAPQIIHDAPAMKPQPIQTRPWSNWTWREWLLLVWLGGALIRLTRVGVGILSLWLLQLTSKRINDAAWLAQLETARSRLRLRQNVALLRSKRNVMPMTWGLFQPKLLLPRDCDTWSSERCRVVLLHELAHIKRGDCLTHLLMQLAGVLHWFNPLIWLASRRIAVERERACDDLVLAAGSKASDYAEHLVQVAASSRTQYVASAAAIAMARPSTLEGRLRAILDQQRNRGTLTRMSIIVAIALMAGVLLPVSTMRARTLSTTLATTSQPQLRFLAWQGTNKAGETCMVCDGKLQPAWYPTGEPISKGNDSLLVGTVSPTYLASGPALFLWFSVPDADKPSGDSVSIDDFGSGTRWENIGTSVHVQPEAPAEDRNWIVMSVAPKDAQIPATADVTLRYSADTWTLQPQQVGADFVGNSAIIPGANITGVGQNVAGHAFVTVTGSLLKSRDTQFGFVCRTKNGKQLEYASFDSSTADDIYTKHFVFDVALSEVKTFQPRTRPIRSITFKNVALDPGHNTRISTTEKPHENSTTQSAAAVVYTPKTDAEKEEFLLAHLLDPELPKLVRQFGPRTRTSRQPAWKARFKTALEQRVNDRARQLGPEQPDAELAQMAWSLATIMVDQSSIQLKWESPAESDFTPWLPEDDNYYRLAEILVRGFDHAPPKSELRHKLGMALAKLEVLLGDLPAANRLLMMIDAKPIQLEQRPFLTVPPHDLAAGWPICHESLRSGNCSVVFQFEKVGKGLAGVHVALRIWPGQPKTINSDKRADQMLLFQPYPIPGSHGDETSFGCLTDCSKTRYGISDETGQVKFEKLPEVPIQLEVFFPTGMFLPQYGAWQLWVETEPGHQRKIENKMGRSAYEEWDPKDPTLVVLKDGQTVHYPRFFVYPEVDLRIVDWQEVDPKRFMLSWQQMSYDRISDQSFTYELEMGTYDIEKDSRLKTLGVNTIEGRSLPPLREAMTNITRETIKGDLNWDIGARGVGGQKLQAGKIYALAVTVRDGNGQIVGQPSIRRVRVRASSPETAPAQSDPRSPATQPANTSDASRPNTQVERASKQSTTDRAQFPTSSPSETEIKHFLDEVAGKGQALRTLHAVFTQEQWIENGSGSRIGVPSETASGTWAKREDGAFLRQLRWSDPNRRPQHLFSITQAGKLYLWMQDGSVQGGTIRNAPPTIPGILEAEPEGYLVPWTWLDSPWFGREYGWNYQMHDEQRDGRTLRRVSWRFSDLVVSLLIDPQRDNMPIEMMKQPLGDFENQHIQVLMRVTASEQRGKIWLPMATEKRWPDSSSTSVWHFLDMRAQWVAVNEPLAPELFKRPGKAEEWHDLTATKQLTDTTHPATQPTASTLEFRIAAQRSASDPESMDGLGKVKPLLDDLQANGPLPGRERVDEFQWFETIMNPSPMLQEATYQGRRYMLLRGHEPFVMLAPKDGRRAWGLKRVFGTKDSIGHPAVEIEFDDAGAELFAKFTEGNVNHDLAILVDGKIVTTARLIEKLGGSAQIGGSFTAAQIEKIVAALSAGMPPATQSAATQPAGAKAPKVQDKTIEQLSRIEGTLYIGAKPAANEPVTVWVNEDPIGGHELLPISYTDAEGRFSISLVQPGRIWVSRRIKLDSNSYAFDQSMPLEIKADEIAYVQLGGKGRPVVGRLTAPSVTDRKIDWEGVNVNLKPKGTDVPWPKGASQTERNTWYAQWKYTPQGRANFLASHHYRAGLKSDGSFRLEDVPAGDYILSIWSGRLPSPIKDDPPDPRYVPLGHVTREFTVAEIPSGRSDEPLDLGTLVLNSPPPTTATQPAAAPEK